MPPAITGTLGVILVLLNSYSSGRFTGIFQVVWNGQTKLEAKSDILRLGGELLFILALTVVAEINNDASNLVAALFIGLILLWSLNNLSTVQKFIPDINKQNMPIK